LHARSGITVGRTARRSPSAREHCAMNFFSPSSAGTRTGPAAAHDDRLSAVSPRRDEDVVAGSNDF